MFQTYVWVLSFFQSYDKCFLGSSETADANRVFCGQLGAIYVFSEALNPAQIFAIHQLGPGYKVKDKKMLHLHYLCTAHSCHTLFCLVWVWNLMLLYFAHIEKKKNSSRGYSHQSAVKWHNNPYGDTSAVGLHPYFQLLKGNPLLSELTVLHKYATLVQLETHKRDILCRNCIHLKDKDLPK